MRATRAIIHLENLEHNIREIKNLIDKNTKICMPVKADAYGHGAVEIAKRAAQCGVYCLAVATVDEGIELRKAGIKCPILLFSLPCPDELLNLVSYEITPFVFEKYFVDELQRSSSRLGKNLCVYLKVDSGMGRIGCKIEDAQSIAKRIYDSPNLKLAGITTHLCVSDCVDEDSIAFTNKQIENFTWAVNSVKAAGLNPGIVSCSASGGVLLYAKKAQFDMVRPGILFYGYYPDECVKDYLIEKNGFAPEFKPVMELKTKIEAIKKVEKGTSISYGRTWTAPKNTYIATLPIGYADGLLRRFSGKLSVRIGNAMYPIVGRICMDQCMVDLGENCRVNNLDGNSIQDGAQNFSQNFSQNSFQGGGIKVWDDVTIFGPEDDNVDSVSCGGLGSYDISNGGNIAINGNTADTLANLADTISYEITCGIHKRVPRVYVG